MSIAISRDPVAVETPRLGHATYVFAKPRSIDSFLALYTRITKDGGTAITQPSGWAFWGGLSTEAIPGRGLRKSGDTSEKTWTLRSPRRSDLRFASIIVAYLAGPCPPSTKEKSNCSSRRFGFVVMSEPFLRGFVKRVLWRNVPP